MNKTAIVLPRKQNGEGVASKDPVCLDMAKISSLFKMSISLSALRNACRHVGLEKWPYSRNRDKSDMSDHQVFCSDGSKSPSSSSEDEMYPAYGCMWDAGQRGLPVSEDLMQEALQHVTGGREFGVRVW
ncbi:hypothetical protein GUITHDRAFT_155770 [Guillardia theta CCMP2712]|uniref:RWP-RK domain-containing protein n=1 Tax=Guillardia theta (strain CCMP2712) TaxID=905079 RepID=L1IDI6_GUITC|nr:hypothetical protein GUITHDRAFT_155770 [Guillardia theta CCMP2712]EKX34311.1 hypothetical protein GUITHDRAFT_155770 [Guillardia theta CCMP2712]|eukprot:XP_005821291.1 hypothetical protein GUITHDRAFT_155770 [Guillardia theta CCMP2712]